MMNKIGILGGTFDPVHNGHIKIAQIVMEKMNLSKIIFIPTGIPPHKHPLKITATNHRYNMVELAIKGIPNFEISPIEIENKQISYTIDTLRKLKNINKDTEFYYIVGADALFDITGWKDFIQLFAETEIVALSRNSGDIGGRTYELRQKYNARVHTVYIEEIDISSTYIRENFNMDECVADMLPKNVYEYIKSRGIYDRITK